MPPQAFAHDGLNRLATAETPNANLWGKAYTYDIWGNLLQKTVTKGTATPLSVQATAKNQITGYCYDAAGNLLREAVCGTNTYTYDAENRLSTTASVTYTYDGDGKRVRKSNGKLYWPGLGLDALLESDLNGNSMEEYIFFAGRRVARRKANGAIEYYFADHLGSSRVVTNTTGTVLDRQYFLPFEGIAACDADANYPCVSNSGQNYKFTGKERDTESGLDYFGARYYGSSFGRFGSSDPGAFAIRHAANPQKWNRYSYTINNPTIFVDPDGQEELSFTIKTSIPWKTTRAWPFSATYNGGPKTTTSFRIETDRRKAATPLIAGSLNEVVHPTIKNGGEPREGAKSAVVNSFRAKGGGLDLAVAHYTQNAVIPASPVPALSFLQPGVSADLTFIISADAQSILIIGNVTSFPSWEITVTYEDGTTQTLYQLDPSSNNPWMLLVPTRVHKRATRPVSGAQDGEDMFIHGDNGRCGIKTCDAYDH